MVGPTDSEDERRSATRRFRAGFVILVGLSGGLGASAMGASVTEAAVVAAVGLAVGVVLMWWLVRSYRQIRPGR